MWRIRRFHVDSLGVRDNRFVDVTVDLTGMDGSPADSIVWLRNGAGKTTMLSLLLAHILPDRRDFLARKTGKQRTLEDLVLPGDTGHVACEWVDPVGTVLLTGAVYEWAGRSRPRDYNTAEGRKGFHRRFWVVRADPTVSGATFDSLPFFSRSGGRVDLMAFADHIRGLARQGVDAVVEADSVAQWHAALTQRRFDPELFRYFAIVNGTEGGLENLFSGIDSPHEFARFLLRFVTDPQRAVGIKRLLEDTAAEIAKRPAYEADREFSRQLAPRLEALADAHERTVEARKALDVAEANASTLRRDLLDGAAAAEAEADRQERKEKDAYSKYQVAVRERATQRRVAENLRWAEARFELDRARDDARAAKKALEDARRAVDAWDACAILAEMGKAQAELTMRRIERDEAQADARPLVDAHGAAQRRLRATLGQRITANKEAISNLRDALANRRSDKERLEEGREALVFRLAILDTERKQAEKAVADFESEVARAVDAGYLRRGETPAAAHRRHEAARVAAKTEVTALTTRKKELESRDRELDDTYDSARRAAGDAQRVSDDKASAHHERLTTAAELAGSARLAELAQSDDVDVDSDGPALLAALADALGTIDARIIDERVDGAEDERALDALADTGLLPPRRAVTDVVHALGGLGFRAWPGWTYLAERVQVADHPDRLARYPDVVDGVVVYDDPATVAAALHDAGHVPADLVVIARASALAGGDHREPGVVVGPAAARHDPAAASSELAARRAARDQRAKTIAALHARRRDDATLKERLDGFLSSLPPGGLAASAAEAEAAAGEAHERDAEARTAKAAVVANREELKQVEAALGEAQELMAALDVAIAQSETLARRADDSDAPARAKLATVGTETSEAKRALDDTKQRLGDLDKAIRQAEREVTERKRDVRLWEAEAGALPEAAGVPAAAETLDALRHAVKVAEDELREAFDDTAFQAQVNRAEDAVTEMGQRLNRFPEATVARAKALMASPEGADEESRERARARAETMRDDALATEALARQAVTAAESAVRDAEPDRRVELDPEPRSAAEARERAERAERIVAQRKAAESEADQESKDAEAAARRARERAGMLRDQADKLRMVEPAVSVSGTPLPEAADAVRSLAADMAAHVEEAAAKHGSAMTGRSHRVDELRRFAGDDRFAHLSETEHGQAIRQVRAFILGDEVVDKVAPQARDLAAELVDRAEKIVGQLERVEQHKRNVVARLGELVHAGLADLARVSRLSALPAGIGPWEGRQFIRVGVRGDKRPTPEQVEVRVGELVDDMVVGGRVVIEPVELLWRAIRAAVGPAGFHASILKPSPEQSSAHVPVTEMNKWSGGETLTASLLIFCVMARLRAENRQERSRGKVHAGVVPLDNPVGKANYREFLQLQRRVAAANGAQLLFWTGIADLGAVTTFPRIVAMRKAASADRAGAAYVIQDDARSQRVTDDVEGLRVEASAAVRSEQGALEL